MQITAAVVEELHGGVARHGAGEAPSGGDGVTPVRMMPH
jgi:hypothetical protein